MNRAVMYKIMEKTIRDIRESTDGQIIINKSSGWWQLPKMIRDQSLETKFTLRQIEDEQFILTLQPEYLTRLILDEARGIPGYNTPPLWLTNNQD